MRLFLYVSVYALAIAGLCVAVAPTNAAGCNQLVGTADGWDKSDALSGSQAALAQEVNDFKKGKGAVTVTAMKARPQPNWRESASDYLYVKPGRGNGQVLHRLLARRGVAGSLHLRRQGLLVASPIGHGQAANDKARAWFPSAMDR